MNSDNFKLLTEEVQENNSVQKDDAAKDFIVKDSIKQGKTFRLMVTGKPAIALFKKWLIFLINFALKYQGIFYVHRFKFHPSHHP